MGRLLALLVVLAAAPASADVLKLFVEAHGGGMYGTGLAGDQKDTAFFKQSPRGTYGALVGAELLFFDGLLQHHQYTNGSRITTWTQFGLGVHNVLDTGSEKDRKEGKGGYVELAANLWFGIGTGQQAMLPLDNSQLSDKGFLAEARLGFGTHLDSHFDLGLVAPVSYGFFFKTGNGAGVNNTSNQYRGVEGELLVALRVRAAVF